MLLFLSLHIQFEVFSFPNFCEQHCSISLVTVIAMIRPKLKVISEYLRENKRERERERDKRVEAARGDRGVT